MLVVLTPIIALNTVGNIDYIGDVFGVYVVHQFSFIPVLFVLFIVAGLNFFSNLKLTGKKLLSAFVIFVSYIYVFEVFSSSLINPRYSIIEEVIFFTLYYYVLITLVKIKYLEKVVFISLYYALVVRLIIYFLVSFDVLPGAFSEYKYFFARGERVDIMELNVFPYVAVILIWLLFYDVGVKFNFITKIIFYLLSVAVIVMSISRSALLALLIIFIIYVICQYRLRAIFLYVLSFTFIVFVVEYNMGYFDSWYDVAINYFRLDSIIGDESFKNRYDTILLSKDVFLKYYGLGSGAKHVWLDVRVNLMLPHSSLIVIALSYGVIGLLFFIYTFFLMLFGDAFKLAMLSSPLVLSGIFLLLLAFMVDPYIREIYVPIVFAIYFTVNNSEAYNLRCVHVNRKQTNVVSLSDCVK